MGSSVFAQKANFEACVKFSERNLSDYVHSLSVYPSWIGNSDFSGIITRRVTGRCIIW